MPRTNLPWTPSKRGLCRRAGKGQSNPPEGHAHRNLVPGRSPHRSEEQDHAALGQTRDAAIGTKGSADKIGVYLWRYLPGTGQGRSEEHTSELQSLMRSSYAVFCLKKKK